MRNPFFQKTNNETWYLSLCQNYYNLLLNFYFHVIFAKLKLFPEIHISFPFTTSHWILSLIPNSVLLRYSHNFLQKPCLLYDGDSVVHSDVFIKNFDSVLFLLYSYNWLNFTTCVKYKISLVRIEHFHITLVIYQGATL